MKPTTNLRVAGGTWGRCVVIGLIACASTTLLAQVATDAWQKDATMMRQYNWNSRTELVKDGKVEDIRIDSVTFGPDGMTGHPDHCTISRWATQAWRRLGAGRLWYATVTPGFHQEWGAVNNEIGLWADPAHPPCTPEEDIAFRLRCEGDVMSRKQAALRAHRSQTAPLLSLLGEGRYREWWRYEYFRAAS